MQAGGASPPQTPLNSGGLRPPDPLNSGGLRPPDPLNSGGLRPPDPLQILSLFTTRASHYHREICFFLQFLKLVLILILALPKSKNHRI